MRTLRTPRTTRRQRIAVMLALTLASGCATTTPPRDPAMARATACYDDAKWLILIPVVGFIAVAEARKACRPVMP
jgi:transposase